VAVLDKLNLISARAVPKDSDRRRVIHLLVESSLNIRQLADSDQPLSESEGYVLQVLAARRRVVVSGLTTAGVFYGLQSLLSLLADNWTLPAVGQAPLCFARGSCLSEVVPIVRLQLAKVVGHIER